VIQIKIDANMQQQYACELNLKKKFKKISKGGKNFMEEND